MKVTVNAYLNIRVGNPSVNAPCYNYLTPGSELEIEALFYKGDLFEGSDDWVRDTQGNYCWAGGVNCSPDQMLRPDYWFDELGIAEIWDKYGEEGERANILVLDSGINNHLSALLEAVDDQDIHSFVGEAPRSAKDDFGHGTHCAGIIAARKSVYKVGIAPKARLLVGKINENGSMNSDTTLLKALEFFLNYKIDIHVISLSISAPITQMTKLIELLDAHIEKGRVIIAAIGNDNKKENRPFKRYPGYLDQCIAIGACEPDGTLSRRTLSPDKVSVFCYGTDIASYKKEESPAVDSGTSQATAIVAGLCGLIVSFLNARNIRFNQASIKSLLTTYSIPMEGANHYKIISPSLIFSKLSQLKNENSQDLQDLIEQSV